MSECPNHPCSNLQRQLLPLPKCQKDSEKQALQLGLDFVATSTHHVEVPSVRPSVLQATSSRLNCGVPISSFGLRLTSATLVCTGPQLAASVTPGFKRSTLVSNFHKHQSKTADDVCSWHRNRKQTTQRQERATIDRLRMRRQMQALARTPWIDGAQRGCLKNHCKMGGGGGAGTM